MAAIEKITHLLYPVLSDSRDTIMRGVVTVEVVFFIALFIGIVVGAFRRGGGMGSMSDEGFDPRDPGIPYR